MVPHPGHRRRRRLSSLDLRPDPWLARILDREAYRVELEPGGEAGVSPAAVEGLRAHAAARPAAMYSARVPTTRIADLHALEEAGFRVVDVNVSFGLEAATAMGRRRAISGSAEIVEARAEHHADLLDIAGSCFRYSRFHLDPVIPVRLAHQIKREWVASYVRKERGTQLLAALADGRPAGFLAVLAGETHGQRLRIIDLIGVAPALQGRGIGRALTAAFVAYHADQCDRLEVGTQVANVPSMRLYESQGFAVARTHYVMHMHTGGFRS